jgi:alpha-L-arabinofuranosidase
MTYNPLSLASLAASLLLAGNVAAQSSPTRTFTVKAHQPYAQIAPTMYGLFFEDINLGADGGVYAELVKNRSFEFDTPLMGWKELKRSEANGDILVLNTGIETKANPRFIRLTSKKENTGYGMANEGFRGMGIKQGEQYNFTVQARVPGNNSAVPLTVKLVNTKGEELAAGTISPTGQEWKTYAVSLTATATEGKAQLQILPQKAGVVDLDMISLFPKNTWKQRPNGLRADMVQLLADMKPGFLRFPGGCIVEGRTLDNRFQWKKTIGPVAERETMINRWNTEFQHRHTPDYFQTFGLGFFEYFQLAEDIGAAPLPILNCGMACQYNTGEVVPLDQLEPFIQDALDLIEFANGSVETEWGKVRAQMGHPAPFNLKYLGVGNEQWGPQYVERYQLFAKALKAKYPEVQLISSVGPSPDGERFDYLSKAMRDLKADIVDEHYYKSPEWFLQSATRYDTYDRQGPKVFAGEYAAHATGIDRNVRDKNIWHAALSEAAFMTGLERNADVVTMASYAPLFAHAEAWQWNPDLIWIDNLRIYGTPNYYVQKLFATNKGTHVVPMLLDNKKVTGQDGLYATAALDKTTKELILKVVNANATAVASDIALEGVNVKAKGTLLKLSSPKLDQTNSFENPTAVSPVQEAVQVKNKKVKLNLAPYSVNIVKVKLS